MAAATGRAALALPPVAGTSDLAFFCANPRAFSPGLLGSGLVGLGAARPSSAGFTELNRFRFSSLHFRP